MAKTYEERIENGKVVFIPKIGEETKYQIKKDYLHELFDEVIKKVYNYNKNYPLLEKYAIKSNGLNKEKLKELFNSYVEEKTKLNFPYSAVGLAGGVMATLASIIIGKYLNLDQLISISSLWPLMGMAVGMSADLIHDRRVNKIKKVRDLISFEE
jgi:hypothetical protein